MVWSQEREAEQPPLSVILPRLYLGAESDVTQAGLASLGISYVLSVSRCSPQPSFLPHSRYLRIPIDDSLRDDMLPWIPQALHFIDAAMSSGASVLVHCAAGISRSPALAVAYIMYSLGMDLDHAYRFVKERRPSISPNFNFLGQLQHFQGTLSLQASGGDLLFRQLDSRLPSAGDSIRRTHVSRNMNDEADSVPGDPAGGQQARRQRCDRAEEARQRRCHSSGRGNQQLFLSGKLRTLRLTLSEKDSGLCEAPAPGASEPAEPAAKPARLQLPAGSAASLLEKRKSLTLSLTPLGSCPLVPAGSGQRAGGAAAASKSVRDGEGTQGHAGDALREGKEQGPLSPFSFTLNKLLGWGERVLLGGALVHTVRMGQPALPYRC